MEKYRVKVQVTLKVPNGTFLDAEHAEDVIGEKLLSLVTQNGFDIGAKGLDLEVKQKKKVTV